MKQKLPEPTTFKEKEAVTPSRLKAMEKSSEAFGGNCLQYICSYYTKKFSDGGQYTIHDMATWTINKSV